MKFEGISVDDILANSKPEAVEQEAQVGAEKTGLDFSSVGVDSLIADRDQQSLDATSAVTAKAPDLANRERMIAEKMEILQRVATGRQIWPITHSIWFDTNYLPGS